MRAIWSGPWLIAKAPFWDRLSLPGRRRDSRHRESTTHLNTLRPEACDDGCIPFRTEGFSNEPGNDTHFGFTHATRRRCRCTEANAAWFERRTRIIGNDLLVHGHADSVENSLGRAAVQADARHRIHNHHVIVGSV